MELGCGTGKWTYTYKELGLEPWGIDISKKRVKLAKQRGMKAQQGDATKLPYSDQSFDFVNCVGTLVHIKAKQRRQKIFQEAYRVLKLKGVFTYEYVNKRYTKANHKFVFGATFQELLKLEPRFKYQDHQSFCHMPLPYMTKCPHTVYWLDKRLNSLKYARLIFVKLEKEGE